MLTLSLITVEEFLYETPFLMLLDNLVHTLAAILHTTFDCAVATLTLAVTLLRLTLITPKLSIV